MAEHLSVNVAAQVAKRLFREAEYLREQAAAALEDGDRREHRVLSDQAEATERESRRTILEADSLDDDTDPATLEPVTRTPVTKEWEKDREAVALERAWAELRVERDARLAASDWTQQPDAPADSAAWAAYRQQLRDLPAKTKDPRQAEWPEVPA